MPKIRKRKFNVQYESPEGSGNFKVLECEGTPVVIAGYESITFMYYTFPPTKQRRICELLTSGIIVREASNKAEAVSEAKKNLDAKYNGDVDKFKRRMRYIKDNLIKVKGYEGGYLNEEKGSLL